jgi:hypothetical protein
MTKWNPNLSNIDHYHHLEKPMKFRIFSLPLLAVVFVLVANVLCAAEIDLVDPKTRDHLQTELHMGDYLALSETVTNKMLASGLVQGWGGTRPKLIVGVLVNNTDNESIRMTDLHDRIAEVILGSGLVRLMDVSATAFDYVIKSELTSTRQYGEKNQEIVFFTLQLKMFTLEGELVGQWSDDVAMAKGKKKLFGR